MLISEMRILIICAQERWDVLKDLKMKLFLQLSLLLKFNVVWCLCVCGDVCRVVWSQNYKHTKTGRVSVFVFFQLLSSSTEATKKKKKKIPVWRSVRRPRALTWQEAHVNGWLPGYCANWRSGRPGMSRADIGPGYPRFPACSTNGVRPDCDVDSDQIESPNVPFTNRSTWGRKRVSSPESSPANQSWLLRDLVRIGFAGSW